MILKKNCLSSTLYATRRLSITSLMWSLSWGVLSCVLSLLCCCTNERSQESSSLYKTNPYVHDIDQEADEPVKTEKKMVKTRPARLQSGDTITVRFSDKEEYKVYIKRSSYDGPKDSWSRFVMCNETNKVVFKSFDKEYDIEEYPDDEVLMGLSTILSPVYNIGTRHGKDILEVNLMYINYAKDLNGYSPDAQVPEDYLGLKHVETQGNLYRIGFIEYTDGALGYTSLYEPYPCSVSLDSLEQLYEQKKAEEDRKTLPLLESVYKCGLSANDTSSYDEMASFSEKSSGSDIFERRRYYYLYRFLTYHLRYPFNKANLQ